MQPKAPLFAIVSDNDVQQIQLLYLDIIPCLLVCEIVIAHEG